LIIFLIAKVHITTYWLIVSVGARDFSKHIKVMYSKLGISVEGYVGFICAPLTFSIDHAEFKSFNSKNL